MARRGAEPDSNGVSKSGTIGLRRSDRFLAGLHAASRVVFVSHVQPDPDSLGSMLGLAHLVETRLGKPTLITRDGLILRMKDDDWSDVLKVNLESYFRLARAATKGMMRRRHGRIIGITSVVGVTGNPGQTNYAASKAGMIGFSKALAQEVAARNVTVNCVAPGFIASPMTDALNEAQRDTILSRIPAGRLGQGSDVAAACVYLASEEAAYVTGQTLHVNGGMAMP